MALFILMLKTKTLSALCWPNYIKVNENKIDIDNRIVMVGLIIELQIC